MHEARDPPKVTGLDSDGHGHGLEVHRTLALSMCCLLHWHRSHEVPVAATVPTPSSCDLLCVPQGTQPRR